MAKIKKCELKLEECELTAQLILDPAYCGEGERTCDMKFKSNAADVKLYMMESDARQLATWILENTKERTLQ